jgi:hypothetical protein
VLYKGQARKSQWILGSSRQALLQIHSQKTMWFLRSSHLRRESWSCIFSRLRAPRNHHLKGGGMPGVSTQRVLSNLALCKNSLYYPRARLRIQLRPVNHPPLRLKDRPWLYCLISRKTANKSPLSLRTQAYHSRGCIQIQVPLRFKPRPRPR